MRLARACGPRRRLLFGGSNCNVYRYIYKIMLLSITVHNIPILHIGYLLEVDLLIMSVGVFCLFVWSINSNENDPKMFKLGGIILGLGLKGQRSQVQ